MLKQVFFFNCGNWYIDRNPFKCNKWFVLYRSCQKMKATLKWANVLKWENIEKYLWISSKLYLELLFGRELMDHSSQPANKVQCDV